MLPSGTLVLGQRSLREILTATPIGYVTAIASTALNIVEAVQGNDDINKDLQRLTLRVIELSMACAASMARSGESESRYIQLYTGVFIKSLEDVANTVSRASHRGLLGGITGKLSMAKTVRGLEEELEHSSSLLLLHLQFANLNIVKKLEVENNTRQTEVHDAIAAGQKEQLDLLRARITKASERRGKDSVGFSHYPPPPPQHFFGRKEYVQHLVGCIQNVPSYQAILGPGGMGKTSLSLHVFHDPRTVAVYGKNRYFLSCESIQDADGFAAGLANIFELQEKNIVSQLKRVCSVIGSNILFLLDNFETTWEPSDNREAVEAILADITSIPNLSLIITLRGGERPAGVAWTQPFLPAVVPLSLEESKQLFISIADTQRGDPLLEELVNAVEGLPLAVTLLATQAQSSGCSLLLSAWEEQKTSMVTRGFDGRLSSLDSSINLSIVSSRMKGVDSALPTLQILSDLPDGATSEDLGLMNPGQAQTILGAMTLCQVSLAYHDDHQRLRVLSPIREFVKANYPPKLGLLEQILDHHGKLSRYAAEAEVTSNWSSMVELLAPCIGNIHSIIFEALVHESLALNAAQAATHVVGFHNCAFLGSIPSLLKASLAQAQRFRFPKIEADCYLKLASIHFTSLESQQYWEPALSIYRSLDAQDSLLKALIICAKNANANLQNTIAKRHLNEAAGILSTESSAADRFDFLVESGRLCTNSGDSSAAQKHFRAAVLLSDRRINPWTAERLYSCLCYHYIYFDKYDAAIEAGKTAQAVPGLRDHWRTSPVLSSMAIAYFFLGRTSEAEEAINKAFEISLRFARDHHMAWTKSFIALFAIANQRLDEAESQLHGAWVLLQLTNDENLRYRFVCLLGLLELFRNHTATANAHFEEVNRIGQKFDIKIGVVDFYLLPKAHILSRTGMAGSSITYGICSVVQSRDAKQDAEIAISLLVLGDAFILHENPDTVTTRSCYEVAFGILRNLGNRRHLAHCLVRLATIDHLETVSSEDLDNVVRRLNDVAVMYRRMGHYPAERYCLDQVKSIEMKERLDVATLLGLPFPVW